MNLKTLQESLKDLETITGDSITDVFLVCGPEKFNIASIRLSHVAYVNGSAVTNQVYFDLTRLVNL
jgi:hypothetical protein